MGQSITSQPTAPILASISSPRADVPLLVIKDGMVTTRYGKQIPAPPLEVGDTDRKAKNWLKKMELWLQKHAIEAALAEGNTLAASIAADTSAGAGSMPAAAWDAMNLILFGHVRMYFTTADVRTCQIITENTFGDNTRCDKLASHQVDAGDGSAKTYVCEGCAGTIKKSIHPKNIRLIPIQQENT